MKTKENTLPSEIEEAIQSRAIEDFRKTATSALIEKLMEMSDRQLKLAHENNDGEVQLIRWGTFKFPKEVKTSPAKTFRNRASSAPPALTCPSETGVDAAIIILLFYGYC